MKSILIFIRAGMLPLTMLVPLLGYWSNQEATGNPVTIIFLLLTGASAHIFGFGLNDLIDLEIDKNVDYRKDSPLVTGQLSLKWARIIVFTQCILMLGFYNFGYIFKLMLPGNVFLLISIFLSVVYNLFSKKGFVPRWLAELSLAASITMLCLAGAFCLNHQISFGQLLFAILLGMILLSINSLGSGLKDLKTDLENNGQSYVITHGARMIGEDRIFIPARLRLNGLLLQTFIFMGSLIYTIDIHHFHWAYLLSSVFYTAATFHFHLMITQNNFPDLIRKSPLLYGYLNLAALALLLSNVLPLILMLIIIALGIMALFHYFRIQFLSK